MSAGMASEEPIAHYEYDIGAGRCKVDIYEIEVDVVEDDWPESHERRRVWLSPRTPWIPSREKRSKYPGRIPAENGA